MNKKKYIKKRHVNAFTCLLPSPFSLLPATTELIRLNWQIVAQHKPYLIILLKRALVNNSLVLLHIRSFKYDYYLYKDGLKYTTQLLELFNEYRE